MWLERSAIDGLQDSFNGGRDELIVTGKTPKPMAWWHQKPVTGSSPRRTGDNNKAE